MKLLPVEDCHIPLICKWLSKSRCEWLDFGEIKEFTPLALKVIMRKKDDVYRLFTTEEDPSQPIGIVALHNVHTRYKTASSWVVLGKPKFSKYGHSYRACIEILKIAFSELGLESVNVWVVDGNRGSIRLLNIMGFHYVGRQRRCHLIHGKWRDRLLFDLLAAEFAENLPQLEGQPLTPLGIVFPDHDRLEYMLRLRNGTRSEPILDCPSRREMAALDTCLEVTDQNY
jgi:RimJ/RimL family protein N-acetyltransferase